MKERLEAVTGGSSRKNSIKSNASKKSDVSMEAQGGDPTGKLAETKKMLIEQKLGTGNTFEYYQFLFHFFPNRLFHGEFSDHQRLLLDINKEELLYLLDDL